MLTFAAETNIRAMKKEFGKWLMDIAKYITTAVILSSMFSSIEEAWVMYVLGLLSASASLIGGMWLLKEKKQQNQ